MTEPRDPSQAQSDQSTPLASREAPASETSSDSGSTGSRLRALVHDLGNVEQQAFCPGQVVNGRFQVVRFLARGGMGEVYEAKDLRLKERVALKTIRPEVAQDPRVMVRFEREIRLARKVTHPNVCRIFDLQTHRSEGGRDITFLSMELLSGETLSAHLKARGRLGEAEALPLVRQMCAALAAAHEAGVVHRDFKCQNVMLCGPGVKRRLVVTDFGLAQRRVVSEDSETSITAAGKLVGTPDYMAPEQVEGRELTAATDLYALGLVMYEMLTGDLPFRGDTPEANLVRRVKEPVSSPRNVVPELSARWEAAILRCLEREPDKRFQSAAQLLEALEPSAALPSSRRPRLQVLGAVASLLALGLAVGAGMYLSRQTEGPGSRSAGFPQPRRSVAVLGFKNLSGRADTAWLSTALAELLTTELAAGEKLRTVPGENVARMRSDLSLAEAESYSEQTLARIHKNLGTDLIVLGSYLVAGDEADRQVRLDLRVQDAVGGETLASMSEEGTEAQVLQLVTHAGARLRAKLGVGELSAEQVSDLGASRPSSPEAARLYAEGLAKVRVYDYEAARQLLEKAVAVDPDYSLAHSALAEAWSYLGHDTAAQQEAKKAFELSEKLLREDRLLIEGRYWESQNQWEKAIEIYRSLFTFFPDDIDHGLRLAAAQYNADQVKAARVTIELLRKLPAPANDDARIDQQAAWMDVMLRECKEAQIAAAGAVTKARAQGALLLSAKARRTEALAWDCLGEKDKAAAILEEVKGIFVAAGDRRTAATTAQFLGSLLAAQGDFAGARRAFQESLATCRELGFRAGVSESLWRIARVTVLQGDLVEARKIYEELLADDEREIADKGDVAFHQGGLAWVLQTQGHLAEARHLHEESLAVLRESGLKRDVTPGLFRLGALLAAEGDLAGARKYDEEALAVAKETGDKTWTVAIHIAIARLSLDEEKPAEAEALAREALKELHRQKLIDWEWSARAVLALSLLAQSRLAEAQEQIAGAAEWAQKTQSLEARLEVLLADARVRCASGKPKDVGAAVKSLEATVQEAAKAGFVELQLEGRVELGRLQMSAGRVEEGRALLDAVAAEAEAKGFKLIARKAAATR